MAGVGKCPLHRQVEVEIVVHSEIDTGDSDKVIYIFDVLVIYIFV